MKSISAFMAAFMMLHTPISQCILTPSAASGECGDSLKWEYANHVLSIDGEGEMWNFKYNQPEWNAYKNEIRIVDISEGCTTVSVQAFQRYPSIQSIHLPDSLTEIGDKAFQNCVLLTSLIIPEHIETIGMDAFFGCKSLAEIAFGDSLTQIGERAFYGCESLSEIDFPASLQILEARAFGACTKLKTVSMQDGLQVLGDYCFLDCESLVSATPPNSIKKIGTYPFCGVSDEFFTSFADDILIFGDILYLYRSDAETFTVPSNVRSIYPYAFSRVNDKELSGNTTMKSLVIPNTVTELQDYALAKMYALEHLEYANPSPTLSYTVLDNNAWVDTFDDTFVIWDGNLLRYNGTDTCIAIPEGVTNLCGNFSPNLELHMVKCPSTLKSLGNAAFSDQSKLFSVELNDGLQSIGDYAFSGCKYLREVEIPSTVTSISSAAASDAISASQPCGIQTVYGTTETAKQFAKEYGWDILESPPEIVYSGQDMRLNAPEDIFSFNNSSAYFGTMISLEEEHLQAVNEYLVEDTQNIESWTGSCFGMSTVAILVKLGLLSPADLDADAHTLSEVRPTPHAISVINYYQMAYGFDKNVSARNKFLSTVDPSSVIYQIAQKAKAIEKGDTPSVLAIEMPSFSHAVVLNGHEIGRWEYNGQIYDNRILVYDCNYPNTTNEDCAIYYQSSTLHWCFPIYHLNYCNSESDNCLIFFMENNPVVLNDHPVPKQTKVVGDLNGDGTLTMSDAVLLSRIVAEEYSLIAPDDTLLECDFSPDKFITCMDVLELLNMIAKIDS